MGLVNICDVCGTEITTNDKTGKKAKNDALCHKECLKVPKLKTYDVYKNGTQQGTVTAYSKKEAENKVFATYGEHRQVEKQ